MSLRDSFCSTEPVAEVFSDGALLEAMLRFEAGLARVQAGAGVIPAGAAAAIAAAAVPGAFDAAVLARDSWSSATLGVPLVDALRSRVASIDPAAATYVHWGATSQDVVDTALVLCLHRAASILEADHRRLQQALRQQSEAHAATIMLGRTLLQPAAPITFGLKASTWSAAVSRTGTRLFSQFDEAAVVQYGGASGTLASLGDQRAAVAASLAHELGLREPDAPWHASRDRLASLVAACGVYCGTLAKIARDIALLMQEEVAEAFETGGRSSAMPHKRNPSGCAVTFAAASRLPGLVAAILAGMPQEHERGVGGWIAEAPTVSAAVEATGASVAALANVVATLKVDARRMRTNLANTRDVVDAERALMLLAPVVGREAAARLVEAAVEQARRESLPFGDALFSYREVAGQFTREQLRVATSPEAYLVAAEHFRRRQLDG